ncbi:MAG: hypothetical protein Q4B88_02210 [Moraxella sp.]|nr:hypothetical protein [Moraxella sp.]
MQEVYSIWIWQKKLTEMGRFLGGDFLPSIVIAFFIAFRKVGKNGQAGSATNLTFARLFGVG